MAVPRLRVKSGTGRGPDILQLDWPVVIDVELALRRCQGKKDQENERMAPNTHSVERYSNTVRFGVAIFCRADGQSELLQASHAQEIEGVPSIG